MDENRDVQGALLAEQFKHTVDLLRADNEKLKTDLLHAEESAALRLARLEEQARDYESRLRSLQDGVTQFRVLAGLATGGGLLSMLTFIKAIGGP